MFKAIISQLRLARKNLKAARSGVNLYMNNWAFCHEIERSIRAYTMLLRLLKSDPRLAAEVFTQVFSSIDTLESWIETVNSEWAECEHYAEFWHTEDREVYIDHDQFRKLWRGIDAARVGYDWLRFHYLAVDKSPAFA